MSDEQIQDNRGLIQITSLLLSASQTDERLKPLAAAAKKLVLESDDALVELFATFAKQQQQPSIGPSYRPVNPNQNINQLVEQLKQLIAK